MFPGTAPGRPVCREALEREHRAGWSPASDHDAFDLLDGHRVRRPVVELHRLRRRVCPRSVARARGCPRSRDTPWFPSPGPCGSTSRAAAPPPTPDALIIAKTTRARAPARQPAPRRVHALEERRLRLLEPGWIRLNWWGWRLRWALTGEEPRRWTNGAENGDRGNEWTIPEIPFEPHDTEREQRLKVLGQKLQQLMNDAGNDTALKGGTALRFELGLPRPSTDLDFEGNDAIKVRKTVNGQERGRAGQSTRREGRRPMRRESDPVHRIGSQRPD